MSPRLDICGRALYEYEHGTGQPPTRWDSADDATKDRYRRRAAIVLKSAQDDA